MARRKSGTGKDKSRGKKARAEGVSLEGASPAPSPVDRPTQMWRAVAPLTPILTVALGLWWMRAHGVGTWAMVLQGVALGLGLAGFMALQWVEISRLKRALPGLAMGFVVVLGATLLFPGMEGVHRWLTFGPVRLHASALLAPAGLVGCALLLRRGRVEAAMALVVAAQIVHVAQPDAASASGLAAGVIGTLWALLAARGEAVSLRQKVIAGGGTLALIGLSIWAWRRADPLLPVPYVEGIVELAASHGPNSYAAALTALVLVPQVIAGLALRRQAPALARMAAAGIAAHLTAALIATRFGAFPVPLLGLGAGPILGTYLGLGLTAALARVDTTAAGRGD